MARRGSAAGIVGTRLQRVSSLASVWVRLSAGRSLRTSTPLQAARGCSGALRAGKLAHGRAKGRELQSRRSFLGKRARTRGQMPNLLVHTASTQRPGKNCSRHTRRGVLWPLLPWRIVRSGVARKEIQVRHRTARVLPNPSVKRSANGRPPGPPSRYGVHFLLCGPGVLPLAPAYLER